MRLIDADKLACFSCTVPSGYDVKSYMEGIGFVLNRIDEAPTIDAVPVVQCCNCRWFDSAFCFCHKHHNLRSSDYLCVYGEEAAT